MYVLVANGTFFGELDDDCPYAMVEFADAFNAYSFLVDKERKMNKKQ
jgi:hypothetical protein